MGSAALQKLQQTNVILNIVAPGVYLARAEKGVKHEFEAKQFQRLVKALADNGTSIVTVTGGKMQITKQQ